MKASREKGEVGKRMVKGIPASTGIALGHVCVHKDILDHIRMRTITAGQIGAEISRLKEAIDQATIDLERDKKRVVMEAGEESAKIFSSHLSILEDPYFVNRVIEEITRNKKSAEAALYELIIQYGKAFSSIQDAYFRERILDIRDVGKRLLELLMKPYEFDCPFDDPVIIASLELTPRDTIKLKRERVLAFITERGGRESHAAILARSMGIPAVLGIPGLLSRIQRGDFLIVDGDIGFVVINPVEKVIQEYRESQARIRAQREKMEHLTSAPAVTADGQTVRIFANIGSMIDLEYALHYRAEGVGLFRTELPFIAEGQRVSEEEQTQIYQRVLSRMDGQEVTIRTLDLGGDKVFSAPYEEKNPFLGLRSTRFFLKEKEMLREQLRAILSASPFGKAKILFPMITTIEEVRQLRAIIDETKEELRKKRIPFDEGIPLGIMIEIPSAAIIIEKLMREVDFVSIGTNDLVQYALAVDRDNDLVTSLYQPPHPSVIWLIKKVVQAGDLQGKRVSICGEMAGDPFYFPLLFGLGLREFSVNPISILDIKKSVLETRHKQALAVAEAALHASTTEEVMNLLLEMRK